MYMLRQFNLILILQYVSLIKVYDFVGVILNDRTHGEWIIEHTSIADKNLTEHHPDGTVLIYPQLEFWICLSK